jgi:hypothetical protein
MHTRYLLTPFALAAILSGCSLTPHASLDGRAWLLETSGKVAGADVRRDLGYRGISPQLDLEGSASLGRNSITADWAHLSRGANGQVNGAFSFAGIAVPTHSTMTSHTDADLATAFYGYRIGPDVFSVMPGVGVGYARYDVHAHGFTIVPTGAALGGVVPFSAHSRNNQAFPVAAVQAESIPIGPVDLVARADGFGMPQGQMIDGLGEARIRWEHVTLEAGYRYVRINAGDSRITIKGAVVGAGVYF